MSIGGIDLPDERERLIHDLEVHQVELQAQNRELREAQQQLEQSRARYADLYDFAPIAYCTFDPNGVIREINLTGASLLGVERGNLIGRPFIACVPMDDKLGFVSHLRGCMSGRGPCTAEVTLSPPGREPLVLQVASTAYAGPDGVLFGCRSAFTDISDRKKLEDALRRGMQMHQDFLAMVSHELRNPLNSILLGSELLLKQVPATERRKQGRPQLDRILGAARRMTRLVTDLLDLSSMEAGHLSIQREIQDLREVVASALELARPMALDKSIGFELKLPRDPLPADCDRERIVQVLLNLVSNAIKATPKGGVIWIEARTVAADRLICSVRDAGAGFTDEQRRHLFEPYWHAQRTNLHKGVGLGLAIAKGIVAVHGGEIWLETAPGPGSTFSFTLPAPARDLRPARARSPQASPPPERLPLIHETPELERKTLLIVDDEVDARTLLAEILTAEGYRVVTVGDGEQALSLLRTSDEQPALILLDLVMPVMDGWGFLAERARDARLAALPVLLISGQADARKTAAGFKQVSCIEKPIEVAGLLRFIKRALLRAS